jgi:hypothetical protein
LGVGVYRFTALRTQQVSDRRLEWTTWRIILVSAVLMPGAVETRLAVTGARLRSEPKLR